MENDLVIFLLGLALLAVLLVGWWAVDAALVSPIPWR